MTHAATPPVSLTITQPDDWHLHLRDGPLLRAVLPDTVRRFGRALVMPNLNPPITTAAQAQAYRQRILAQLSAETRFEPLLTLYLTDNTGVADIRAARTSGIVHAIKYYPAGATTNSDSGVTNLAKTYAVLEEMQKLGLPLCVHGEVTDPEVDIFDRERVFLDRVLLRIVRDFPALKIVFEHATTKDAIDFVLAAPAHVGATLTPQHLLYNRNALFAGGMRPHHYCLPVLKRETHRQALVAAATSGNPKFFLGTDSAPHARQLKEAACACAGCYTARGAIELYAEAFENAGALHRLEVFASFHGADFYGLPRNSGKITLRREPWTMPDALPCDGQDLVPLRAGEVLRWRLANSD